MHFCHNCHEISELLDGACRFCGESEDLTRAAECQFCMEAFYREGCEDDGGLCHACQKECDDIYKVFLRSLPHAFLDRINALHDGRYLSCENI